MAESILKIQGMLTIIYYMMIFLDANMTKVFVISIWEIWLERVTVLDL